MGQRGVLDVATAAAIEQHHREVHREEVLAKLVDQVAPVGGLPRSVLPRANRLRARLRVAEVPEQSERMGRGDDKCAPGVARAVTPTELDDVQLSKSPYARRELLRARRRPCGLGQRNKRGRVALDELRVRREVDRLYQPRTVCSV